MANPSMAVCIVCLGTFKSERHKNPEYFSSVFNAFCRLLTINIIQRMRWNFEEDDIPFCDFCCSAAEKLKEFYDQLDALPQKIDNILQATKRNILNSGGVINNMSYAMSEQLDRVSCIRHQALRNCNEAFENSVNCDEIIPPHEDADVFVKEEINEEENNENTLSFMESINEEYEFKSQVDSNDPLDATNKGSHSEAECFQDIDMTFGDVKVGPNLLSTPSEPSDETIGTSCTASGAISKVSESSGISSVVSKLGITSKSPHFSHIEVDILVNLVNKYKEILESKKNDVRTIYKKKKYWKLVEQTFNSNSLVTFRRTAETLKKKWDNIKTRRKQLASERNELRKTEGGEDVKSAEDFQQRNANIVFSQIHALPNTFDHDSRYQSNCSSDDGMPSLLGSKCNHRPNNEHQIKNFDDDESDLLDEQSHQRLIEDSNLGARASEILPVRSISTVGLTVSHASDRVLNCQRTLSKSKTTNAHKEVLEMANEEHALKIELLKSKLETEKARKASIDAEHRHQIELLMLQINYWKRKGEVSSIVN